MISNDEVVKQLCLRFQNKPRKCEKINESLIGSNPRIVNVHNGTFCYYHVIQQFEDLDLSKLSSAIPKAGIKLRDIQSIQFPPKRKKEKNYLTITFPKNKTLKYGKNSKEIIVDPDARGVQEWTFSFTYDIVVLPEQEERVREELKKRRENEAKKIDNTDEDDKMSSEFNKFSTQNEKYKEEEDYDEREKSRIEREKMQNVIEKAEEEKSFQEMFNEEYSKISKKPLSELAEIEHNILKIIGKFRARCVEVVKFISNALLSQKIVSKYRFGDASLNQFYYDKIYVKIGEKQINQQFLNMSHVADVVNTLNRKDENRMRVPLACLIKYRSYKCLCTCYNFDNYKETQIVYGLQDVGTIKTNSIISEKLKTICKELNLKPYQTELNRAKEPVYLDPSCRVFKIFSDPYQFQYITILREVFPVDVDLEKNVDQRTIRMRPEYVYSGFHSEPLSGGAFLYSIDDPEGEEEDVQVGKASYLLSHQILPKFVQRLNNLQILLIDSPSIAEALQSNGINIRYIGKIAKLAYLPYIRELMQIEAIARSIKTLFRKQVKTFSEQKFKSIYRPSPYRQDELSKQFIGLFDAITKELVIDFLNLIFSNASESKTYWQEFIKPTCKKKYDLDIKVYPFEVCYGGLLHAVLYHCGIKVDFDVNIKLFNSDAPFKTSDWIGYTVFSKVFEFPGFEIQQLAKKSGEYITANNIDAAIKSLNLQLAIQKALRSSEFQQHCTLPEQKILIKLSKFIPIKTSKFPAHHPSMLQYILNNVNEQNFIKANSIAEFSLPSTHPLFITFYMAFSKIYDKKILYKSSAIVALRSLGAQHEETCKLLTITDRQDVEVLKKAWIDSRESNHEIILIVTQRLEQIGKLNECVEYCQKGIKTLDPPNEKTYKSLITICLRSIKNCYLVRNLSYMLQCITILQKTLEKFDNENQAIYYEMIKYTLKIKLQKHHHKNYIYKLILIIADRILKDRYNEYVRKGHKPPASLTELRTIAQDSDLFQMVEAQERSTILQKIIKLSRQAKSHVHWLGNTLSQVDICFNSLNFNSELFINFEKILIELDNQDFYEGMESLELLAKLYGQELFYKSLIVDVFCEDT